MKFVIQRTKEASVVVDKNVIGEIGKGFLVLIGVSDEDNEAIADKMVKKMLGLRIFEDENGKTNLSLKDVGGSLLLISQFTLYADCKKGNRPSFIKAGAPDEANRLYEYIIASCRNVLNDWKKESAEDEAAVYNGAEDTAMSENNNLAAADSITAGNETFKPDGITAEKYSVQTGSFGADMKVSLINDGPFTIVLDSAEIC